MGGRYSARSLVRAERRNIIEVTLLIGTVLGRTPFHTSSAHGTSVHRGGPDRTGIDRKTGRASVARRSKA